MKKAILSVMFLMIGIGCFAQKSGIILGITDGHLGRHTGYQWVGEGISPETQWTPGIGLNLGYQFNFRLSERFFVDASVLGKVVQGEIKSFNMVGNQIKFWTDKGWIWGAALNGTINYRIYSGLYTGIGVEPTYYLKTNKLRENSNKQLLDFPLAFTIGYEFRNGMKLSASYKHGFKSLYENSYTNNSKSNREIGVSLFIPIFK